MAAAGRDSLSAMSDDAFDPDPLSAVLQDLRLSGVSYGHCRLAAPWGVAFPAEPAARLHLVVAGEGWLRLADRAPIHLGAGDAVLLPQGEAHLLADTPRGATRPLATFPQTRIGERTFHVRGGGDGVETVMACCSVAFGQPALHPLLALMPPVILVCRATAGDPMLPALLDGMADEVVGNRIGAATVLARLADLVVARLVRSWAEGQCADTKGWLAAIRDPRIGRALAAIHRDPGRSWSVDALAQEAGLSRSLVSARFVRLLGVAPGRYLARWRMHLAGGWLRDRRLSVAEIAERLGYESEASFSRAFKRLTGSPPGAVRRGAEPAAPPEPAPAVQETR